MLSRVCLRAASSASSSATVPRVKQLIGGKFVESSCAVGDCIPLISPATGALQQLVPQATPAELRAAEAAAEAALPAWRATPLQQRARVIARFVQLLADASPRVAASVTAEQGKTLADARGDVFRGLECVRARGARGRRAAAAAAPTPAPPSLPLACAQGGRVCGVGAVAADGRDGGQHLGGH
jgi:acyl-CoA reductase-like NAD-dependent aldehyde dehydrogenase